MTSMPTMLLQLGEQVRVSMSLPVCGSISGPDCSPLLQQ